MLDPAGMNDVELARWSEEIVRAVIRHRGEIQRLKELHRRIVKEAESRGLPALSRVLDGKDGHP